MKIAGKEIPEIIESDHDDNNEEISPDGKKIMDAFSSDYIFSIPHLTRSTEQFRPQKPLKALAQ